jgi:methylene-fatty-acyl-phospholipid synthase
MADKLKEVVSFVLENTVFEKKSLLISLASITFNPTAWNLVARNGQFFTLQRIQTYF